MMKQPKMILFDYGHTLAYERRFDAVAGNDALLKYATRNPDRLNGAQVSAFFERMREYIEQPARRVNLETNARLQYRFMFEFLGIEFSLSPLEMELVFWDGATTSEPMPGAAEMLAELHERGIRTGVISNISFSGEALARQIDRLFPQRQFEYIMASSEYVFRKPSPFLFRLALKKAGLAADEVWFCGDNASADIEGASGVGIFPVWYLSPFKCAYYDHAAMEPPRCEFARIEAWKELTGLLDRT